VNGVPLHDTSRDLLSVIFVFEDITERIEYERELEESNERLEQFAYAASHDLQEPLRMVSSYLQLLENRYRDELDEEAEEFIDFAVNGADRMRAMIESLLKYSRVTTGGKPLEPTDAETVLEDVLDDLQLRIEETDATITADELPTVTADADQLAQLFQNLLSNALTYSGDEPPQVHVSAERTDDVWRFSVTDEGIGIDPEHHDRIFDVFERLHTDEEEAGAGVGGIGLALCERIAQRHGGEIWVESRPNEGTSFYFTIPVTRQQQPETSS
jgi:light-regulated signal transduction histidine kinase (bacteriophytochrome)